MDEVVTEVERIVGVAIRSDYDKQVHICYAPKRHHHVVAHLVSKGFPIPIKGVHGYWTSKQRFVDKQDAAQIALKAGQVKRALEYGILSSDDVW